MKIKSKRHPDRRTSRGEILPGGFEKITLPVLPKNFWDMKPIDPADFLPMPPPISAVELQETVELLQRGIISRKQFFGDMLEDAYRDLEAWRNDNK